MISEDVQFQKMKVIMPSCKDTENYTNWNCLKSTEILPPVEDLQMNYTKCKCNIKFSPLFFSNRILPKFIFDLKLFFP